VVVEFLPLMAPFSVNLFLVNLFVFDQLFVVVLVLEHLVVVVVVVFFIINSSLQA